MGGERDGGDHHKNHTFVHPLVTLRPMPPATVPGAAAGPLPRPRQAPAPRGFLPPQATHRRRVGLPTPREPLRCMNLAQSRPWPPHAFFLITFLVSGFVPPRSLWLSQPYLFPTHWGHRIFHSPIETTRHNKTILHNPSRATGAKHSWDVFDVNTLWGWLSIGAWPLTCLLTKRVCRVAFI